LRGHPLAARRLSHLSNLAQVMSQRLLAVNMFAKLDRRQNHSGVGVIRCGDNDAIDRVLNGIEHLPEVLEGLCLRILLTSLGPARNIHVAESHNILPAKAA
jgi:hypothetical protein